MRPLQYALPFDVVTSPPAPVAPPLPWGAISLERIDPARNMARFYHLEVARDLFGSVVLVRQWGRLGTFGQRRLEEYADELEARAALARFMAAKQRRGYRALASG